MAHDEKTLTFEHKYLVKGKIACLAYVRLLIIKESGGKKGFMAFSVAVYLTPLSEVITLEKLQSKTAIPPPTFQEMRPDLELFLKQANATLVMLNSETKQ